MRTTWLALHLSLTRSLNRSSSEAQFQAMRQYHPGPAQHQSIAALMEHQQRTAGDPAARFQVIRDLVAAAQSERPYHSTAQVMAIVALWPGLDAVFWRVARGFPSERDGLAAEILARISEAILLLNLDAVNAVTATLIRNVERDIRRDLIAARVIAQARQPIDDPKVEALATTVNASVAVDYSLTEHLVGLGAGDALLLKRIFILGETQEEAGRALGLTPANARKRFQRAVQKLRATRKNLPALSHSVPPVGL